MKAIILAAAFSIAALPAAAQAPTPRAADGKPDLSGIWQANTLANWSIVDRGVDYASPAVKGIVEGKTLPYQPAAEARHKTLAEDISKDPMAHCHLPGVPRIVYAPYPWKIIQTPKQVLIVYEFAHAWRIIPLNGSDHPADLQPSWNGNSVGRWEGDTLVVDSVGFNDQTWFDMSANFHSDALHGVERYTPVDADHIRFEATIEDPKTFTKPWKMSFPIVARRDVELKEFECSPDESNLSASAAK